MKPRSAALLAVGAAILVWCGTRYMGLSETFAALAPLRTSSIPPRAASQSRTAVPPQNHARQFVNIRAASTPAAKAPDENALAKAARSKLAALRAPLSEQAQNDPFSVLSWLPPPPPPPPPVAEAVQAPAPTAPPLPFTFVGMSNANQAKPQVFLANGDELLIVSPGDVIDGRYRFESIAATAAVFTYLPLEEKQVMTIGGEGN